MYNPFDIVLAKADWRNSDYERPWMIVDRNGDASVYGAFPLSTKTSGNAAGPFFYVSSLDQDFEETGLTDNSYLYYESIIEIAPDEIRKRLGRFANTLLSQVREESGLE